MKTNEQILELLSLLRDEDNCNVLDYIDDAADLIESLAAELEQVKQERDGLSIMLTAAQSAVESYKCERDAAADLKGICNFCAHTQTCTGYWCGDCDEFEECKSPCKNCEVAENWQWCGAKEGVE